MTHDEFKALLPLAAINQLDADEEAALREHLAGCKECDAELRELEHAAAMLALSYEAPGAEDRVAGKIEARLGAPTPIVDRAPSRVVEPSRRIATSRSALRLSIAAALLLALYGTGVTFRLFGVEHAFQGRGNQLAYLQGRFSAVQHQAQIAEQKVNALSRILSERVRLEHVLNAPDLRITHLGPLPPAPGAHAEVVASKSSGEAVIRVTGLPPPPPGKTYQLWWITKQKGPVPAGLFSTEPGREVIARVSPPPAGQHVILSAVTLEPAGGVQKPTGAMYLKGAPERE